MLAHFIFQDVVTFFFFFKRKSKLLSAFFIMHSLLLFVVGKKLAKLICICGGLNSAHVT